MNDIAKSLEIEELYGDRNELYDELDECDANCVCECEYYQWSYYYSEYSTYYSSTESSSSESEPSVIEVEVALGDKDDPASGSESNTDSQTYTATLM